MSDVKLRTKIYGIAKHEYKVRGCGDVGDEYVMQVDEWVIQRDGGCGTEEYPLFFYSREAAECYARHHPTYKKMTSSLGLLYKIVELTLVPDIVCLAERDAKHRLDTEAGEHNQWDSLSQEEKDNLIIKEIAIIKEAARKYGKVGKDTCEHIELEFVV